MTGWSHHIHRHRTRHLRSPPVSGASLLRMSCTCLPHGSKHQHGSGSPEGVSENRWAGVFPGRAWESAFLASFWEMLLLFDGITSALNNHLLRVTAKETSTCQGKTEARSFTCVARVGGTRKNTGLALMPVPNSSTSPTYDPEQALNLISYEIAGPDHLLQLTLESRRLTHSICMWTVNPTGTWHSSWWWQLLLPTII